MDQITREANGSIYKGNVEDKEDAAKMYTDEYDDFIYKAEEAPIAKLEAGDLEETLQDTKETAAGLDQWAPADLKMWARTSQSSSTWSKTRGAGQSR